MTQEEISPPRLRVAILRSVGARGAILPVTALSSVISAALLIDYAGAEAFGGISLVASLFLLLPFADLGLGTSVMTRVSQGGPGGIEACESVRSSLRILMICGIVIAVLGSLGVTVFSWSDVLAIEIGGARATDRATFIALVIFASTVPLSLGQRVLIGLGRNHIAVLANGLTSVIALLYVIAIVGLNGPVPALVLGIPIGGFASALVMTVIGFRGLNFPLRAIRHRSRTLRAQGLFRDGFPMLVVSAMVALAVQSGRVVVSHQADSIQLARYSLLMQFYFPLWSLFAAAGFVLWPTFARARSNGDGLWPSIARTSLLFGAFGLLGGLGIVLFAPPLGAIVSGGEIHLPLTLVGAAGVLLLVQASQLSSGMALTSTSGLRFQALGATLMACSAVPLSWFLTATYGASGPLLALGCAVLTFQVVPGLCYSWRSESTCNYREVVL